VALALHDHRGMNTSRLPIALVGFVLSMSACSVASRPPEQPAAEGRRLYTEYGCYGCHTVLGTGTPIAPDLSHVGSFQTEGELARRLRDPAVHKPGAHMPKLNLTEADIRALAAYLASLR
jgi:mono/diheme cytochrome c family protein